MSITLKLKTRKGVEFLIDKVDFERIKGYSWRFDHGYIRSKNIYLHRFIMNFPKMGIDHKDGNPLNNQKSNLRLCGQSHNCMNKNKTSKKRTSIYKGVHFDKYRRKWVANININYKTYYLGGFSTQRDAALAYDYEALKLFGEFARVNFP